MAKAPPPPRSPALQLYTLGREGGLPFARSAAEPPLSSLRPPPTPSLLQASPTFLLPKPTARTDLSNGRAFLGEGRGGARKVSHS